MWGTYPATGSLTERSRSLPGGWIGQVFLLITANFYEFNQYLIYRSSLLFTADQARLPLITIRLTYSLHTLIKYCRRLAADCEGERLPLITGFYRWTI